MNTEVRRRAGQCPCLQEASTSTKLGLCWFTAQLNVGAVRAHRSSSSQSWRPGAAKETVPNLRLERWRQGRNQREAWRRRSTVIQKGEDEWRPGKERSKESISQGWGSQRGKAMESVENWGWRGEEVAIEEKYGSYRKEFDFCPKVLGQPLKIFRQVVGYGWGARQGKSRDKDMLAQ